MPNTEWPTTALSTLPRQWIDTLFEAALDGGTDRFWLALAGLLLEALPQDVLVVWEAFGVTLFRRSPEGIICVDRNGVDAYALRAPELYNAFSLRFTEQIRHFDDASLVLCGMAAHRFLMPHRPLHACSVDFLHGEGIHCAMVLHGSAYQQQARSTLFGEIVPIAQRIFLQLYERQKQAATGVGLVEFLRGLPVGLMLVDWFFNVLMVNDEGYRHSVLWNEAPRRSGTKNARARFAIAPDIERGWQTLQSQWIESLRTGSKPPPPLKISHAKDAKLRATVSLITGGEDHADGPCFMARFSSVQTRALDDLFEATQQQISVLADLTPTERAVALLIREGLSNREIADRLGREVWTIKSHLTRIFRKTGTRGRSELLRILHLAKTSRK